MPEVSIKSPDEAGAEAILRVELKRNFDAAANGRQVIFKLALPDAPDLYSKLTTDKRVAWALRLPAATRGLTPANGSQPIAA
jgi:fructose-bisphosphate aldolase, class I